MIEEYVLVLTVDRTSLHILFPLERVQQINLNDSGNPYSCLRLGCGQSPGALGCPG